MQKFNLKESKVIYKVLLFPLKANLLGSRTTCNDIYPGYDPVSTKSPLIQC